MDMLLESLVPKDRLKPLSRELFIQSHTFAEKPEITINLVDLSIVLFSENAEVYPYFWQ